jgi:hypothetical protein
MEDSISQLIQISDPRFDRHVRVVEKKYLKLLINFYTCLKDCFYQVQLPQEQLQNCLETCKEKGSQFDLLFKKPLDEILNQFKSCDQQCLERTEEKNQDYHKCLILCRDSILKPLENYSKAISELNLDIFP